MSDPRTLTIAQYADESGLSDESIRTAIRTGKLRALPIGNGKLRQHYRLTRAAIDEFERGEVVQPPAATTRPTVRPRQKRDDFVTYY